MAFHNFYQTVCRGLTEDSLIRINSILGLDGAEAAYSERRAGAVAVSGFEVG